VKTPIIVLAAVSLVSVPVVANVAAQKKGGAAAPEVAAPQAAPVERGGSSRAVLAFNVQYIPANPANGGERITLVFTGAVSAVGPGPKGMPLRFDTPSADPQLARQFVEGGFAAGDGSFAVARSVGTGWSGRPITLSYRDWDGQVYTATQVVP